MAVLVPLGRAQCSQTSRPAAAPAAPAVPPEKSPAKDAGTDSSSASLPSRDVRFATGSAITVLEGTPLQVMNDMPISSRNTKEGAKLSFTVSRDVVVDGVLVVPCGATVYGTIVSAKQANRLVGASHLTLQLTTLNLDGRSYPIYTPRFTVTSASKTGPTVHKVAAGGAIGVLASEASVPSHPYTIVNGQKVPIIYSAADHAKVDAVMAGAGATVGTAIAAATPAAIALIPSESQMEFTLASPIAVYPVDQQTAARMARGMRQGGPVLYVRGESQ